MGERGRGGRRSGSGNEEKGKTIFKYQCCIGWLTVSVEKIVSLKRGKGVKKGHLPT